MNDQDMSRRAVACKGWRWMPGMLAINANGPVRIDGCDSYNEPFVWGKCQWSGERVESWVRELPLPDFRDPATRGCLLELVREAWGNAGICTMAHQDHGGFVWTVVKKADGERTDVWTGTTEAEALVVALEAAGRR